MALNSPTQFDTSFLPQQPLSRVDGATHRKEPISISMIVALIVFFMMLFATGGVILYKKNIERRIDAEKGELASKEKEIDMDTIAGFERLSNRLSLASRILSNHEAFSFVLQILSEGTAVNVGYSKLAFSQTEGLPTISLDGIAPSYAAVYFQGEALRARPFVKSVEIVNPVLDIRTGAVSFQMTVVLQPASLRYGRYFETANSATTPTGKLITNPDASATPVKAGINSETDVAI